MDVTSLFQCLVTLHEYIQAFISEQVYTTNTSELERNTELCLFAAIRIRFKIRSVVGEKSDLEPVYVDVTVNYHLIPSIWFHWIRVNLNTNVKWSKADQTFTRLLLGQKWMQSWWQVKKGFRRLRVHFLILQKYAETINWAVERCLQMQNIVWRQEHQDPKQPCLQRKQKVDRSLKNNAAFFKLSLIAPWDRLQLREVGTSRAYSFLSRREPLHTCQQWSVILCAGGGGGSWPLAHLRWDCQVSLCFQSQGNYQGAGEEWASPQGWTCLSSPLTWDCVCVCLCVCT